MNVLVLGASGIVGTHMRLNIPANVSALFYRRTPDPITPGFDLSTCQTYEDISAFLFSLPARPDCIVNLAGESNPDTVERSIGPAYHVNCVIPRLLAEWCWRHGVKLIQISTQAVFSGDNPSYGPNAYTCPINIYGVQKSRAEEETRLYDQTVLVRLTFVLGIRPMPNTGRKNPLESMLDGSQLRQVDDRWFSPLFARDAAAGIWEAVLSAVPGEVRHLGIPERWSRYEIACATEGNPVSKTFFADIVAVPHDSFKGLAARPRDTTYTGTQPCDDLRTGMQKCFQDCTELHARAREIALFLGVSETEAVAKLAQGFGSLHVLVAEDFNTGVKLEVPEIQLVQPVNHPAFNNGYFDSDGVWQPAAGTVLRTHWPPKSEEELLHWYRETTSYIYELSAFHMDERFKYATMCENIANELRANGLRTVLCLGDGIGDLTLALRRAGLEAVYHDLAGSYTAKYAAFRYWNQTGEQQPNWFCHNGDSHLGNVIYDAICSLDYLEHVTDVEAWVRAIYSALRPGGYFRVQNAFAIGSGADGDCSIPCHLSCNDKWASPVGGGNCLSQWDALLFSLGFEQLTDGLYRKVAK